MSFLNISDPKERESLVNEYLKTRKNIQRSNQIERVADIDLRQTQEKYFKPVTENLKEFASIVHQPKAIEFKSFPSITGYVHEQQQQPQLAAPKKIIGEIGEIAEQYLRKFTSKDDVDRVFGLYDKNGQFYIGDKVVQIDNNNLVINNEEYRGTPGLWELIVSKEPKVYTDEDLSSYAQIMWSTNAMRQIDNPTRPKSSKSYKWKNIVREIWQYKNRIDGSGVNTIILPSDPDALCERLDKLKASKAAGNTGLRNETVSICDELLRQNVIGKKQYKKLMLDI